jgi:two-component system, NtrC family, response regulator HydG
MLKLNKKVIIRYAWEIINAMNDGLIIVDTKGVIVAVNKAMERLTGFTRRELEESDCTILNCDTCEILRSESKKAYCMLFEIEHVTNKRCLMMEKSGKYISVLKNASLLKDKHGKVIGAIETFTDISNSDDKERMIEVLSRLLEKNSDYRGMVGKSQVMQRIYQIIEKAAQSDSPVIIYGESGTGKEMVAQAIHAAGRRSDHPFIRFNCAALNESLLESELFGHVKGAFTGAYRHRQGRFEAAHGGDIFLDEIGDIPIASQAKLLRILETKQFERVGDNNSISVDVRVITATNKDLSDLVSKGDFRQDLFFRINVFPIHLPPLRDRKDDIPLLVNYFMSHLQQKTGKKIHGLSSGVMSIFMAHDWPGNIRELKSVLEYAFVIADSCMILPSHLPERLNIQKEEGEVVENPLSAADTGISDGLDERLALIEALRLSKGNKTEAAKILGIHRMTVWNRMKKYGIGA